MFVVHFGEQKFSVYAFDYDTPLGELAFIDTDGSEVCRFAAGKWDIVYKHTEQKNVDAVQTPDPEACKSGDCGYTES